MRNGHAWCAPLLAMGHKKRMVHPDGAENLAKIIGNAGSNAKRMTSSRLINHPATAD
jgi:hypothetical protein